MKEKIKRISSSTWALLLALMMVVSSFSVLAATTNVNKTGADIVSGDTIYFYPNNEWKKDSAKFGAYFVGTNGDKWIGLFDDDDDKYYSATVPSGGPFSTVKFLRMSSSVSDDTLKAGGTSNPDNVWNNTQNLTKPSDNNCYTLNDGWDTGGTWSTYSGGGTATGHKVCIYGRLSNSFTYWTGFGNHLADAPKFTYDADNKKYVLSNFTTDLSDFSFRVYDETDNKHYCGSNKVTTTLSSGVEANMTIYDTKNNWDEGNTCFKYVGASGKKVNIEIPYNFSTIKVTDAETPVAKSVNLTASPENVVVGGSTTLTANVTELNSVESNVKYTFQEVEENGNAVGNSQELSTNTTTFTDLTEGKHYYKVTVSADGYTSVTDTVVVNVNQPYNVTAKYKTTEDGTTYSAEKTDTNIVTVDGAESSNTSFGMLVAKDTITIDSSTYVFAGWKSDNGSFTDATKVSTTFYPSANADVYAQYKKQYTVSASTTGGNGTINVAEKAPYLAGDTVTININPNSGYQLKSLKRTTGTSSETIDVTNNVTNNKYVVPAISSNETFVAEFEGNPLDYSKYRLGGHFDDSQKWSYASGIEFDKNGKATFKVTNTSGGSGQFLIYDSSGSPYGSNVQAGQLVDYTTPYTTTKDNGYVYYVQYAGTYVVEIVGIDSKGAPKFKVTQLKYQLYISEGEYVEGKLLGNFTKAKDDTYQYIITVVAGTHYFYIKDFTNTDPKVQYSDGSKNCELGKPYPMNYRYDSIDNIQYNLSAGSYKVTYYDINDNGAGKFKIESLAKPLAESVTLSSSATAVKKGNYVTLTAKINSTNVVDGASYTYTFYDEKGKQVGEKKTTKELTATCKTTSYEKGMVSYHVVVSTDATYHDDNYPTVDLTYTNKSSNIIDVDYRDKILYIAEVTDGTLGQLYPLTADSFKPAKDAQSVTIAVFSGETISDETVCNLTVSESKNKYTTIKSSTIDTDDVAGIPTYTIKCNEGASSPTIYIVDDNIYAVATFNKDAKTNTFDNSNTVDYYFAEPTESPDISNPDTGEGLKIYYWNNSVADKNGYANVITKVDKDGKDSGSNTITVNMGDLYISGDTGPKTFNVYKVSLPVWATSFKFVSSGEEKLDTKNTFVRDKAGDASIGLNPNRIYLLYQSGSSYYSRGVVLDSSFWTKTSRENNDVPTKNFKANAVNYNTQYAGDNNGIVTNDFNTYLNALYNTAYANPLFFGYVDPETTEVAGNQNFRIQDNLAMRHDDNHAYYASVQGLAGNTLSSTSKNENGCGYLLTADGSGNMPLFDYKKLESNSNVASNVYEGLNFPFNESTFNGITTYSYDSFTDKNRVIDGGDFKVDEYSNATVGNDKGVGFFPFDKTTAPNNANKYGYGTEFDIDFYMSETGKLTAADGTEKDITFNFSGDDDVWVYVDGVLVLDLGGAHKVSSGSINFSDMQVIYKAAVDSSDNINSRTAKPKTNDKYATDEKYVTTVDLAKIFKANGAEFNNKNSSKKHTLQMFYMERGSFDSNCSISFNLPQNTGLLVRNDVNFDSVNPGLKDATMGVANKDYFSYMIENKYASVDEFNTLKGKYGLPNKTTSADITNNKFTFGTSNPLYPIVTADNIIRRVVDGTTYYLAVKNDSGNSCQSYWSEHLKDAYTGLPSINFSLPDDFAKLENPTDENNSTAVSGQTDTNGGFNLLFNQSAKFNSKIPSNTMVKVVQNETLYEVNAGDSNTAMSVASNDKGKVTRRNVSNFYSTSYKITDDKSQKIIAEEKGNKNSNVFSNDTSAKTDGFYFADYSENHSDSSAMTVNFTNTVSTSDIKIIKNVPTDNSDKVDSKSGDRFTFTVKLSNIFGDKDDTALKPYENLTYKVYDSEGNLEGTRTYGKSGVSITANEYAVITGIPVGTHYEVTEKQRTGYKFDNVIGEFVGTTSNSTKAADQTNEITDTNFIPCNDSVDSTIRTDDTDAKTVKGYMPIANDANNAGKTVQLTYTNKEVGFTISFKYYDREVTTNTVAHINTTPTVVNYVFSSTELATYKNSDDTYDYARMITHAVAAGGINPDNVIDSYKCFTSQAQAVGDSGIKSLPSYRNKVNSEYLTYGQAYSDGNFANHTDCYGKLQDSNSNDGEDWVSYYNGKTKYATEEEAKNANTPVTSITVWFFNNLKTYRPTFHYATARSELSHIDGTSKFVGIESNIINPVFYNVRLGVENGVKPIDEEGIYLKEYGVTGYTGTYSGTAMSIQNDDGKELKFLYWSYDEKGKSIASNSYKYGYRITNDIHLYAIYGEEKDKTKPGLTVSMNNPDYHIDSNGINRVRLNTVMNVYNCPDDDPNIKNVAVIYILDPNKYIQGYIDDKNTTALSNIRTNVYNLIKANGSQAQFSVTIQIDGTNDYKALGLTYTAGKELLTNKNRVQFTTDFKQSALAAQKFIYTFAAMNYESATEKDKTDWIVSDNCIKYMYDEEKGKFTGDLIQVNCLQ